MSKLLINESPLQVLPSLAERIGLNEAIVIQQLHYWLCSSEKKRDGRKWVYNTYENWQKENFPFWSISTIGRIFRKLEEEEIIISRKFKEEDWDQTKWYTLSYQHEILDDTNLTHSSIPKGNDLNRNTETTTETTPENTEEKTTTFPFNTKSLANPNSDNGELKEERRRSLTDGMEDPEIKKIFTAWGRFESITTTNTKKLLLLYDEISEIYQISSPVVYKGRELSLGDVFVFGIKKTFKSADNPGPEYLETVVNNYIKNGVGAPAPGYKDKNKNTGHRDYLEEEYADWIE